MPRFTRRRPQIQLPADLMQAFLDAQSYKQLHALTEEGLSRWFHADHVALCLMSPDLPTGFLWQARTTERFLQTYYQWFLKDFVFQSLSLHPNTALSDVEMLKGGRVEETDTHRRSREYDLRLRRVLAGLMDLGSPDSFGAIALYGEGSRPFSQERRRLLQQLLPYLRSAFRNVRRFDALSAHNQLVEGMLCLERAVAIVVEARRGREVFRAGSVTALLESWFRARSDRDAEGIPRVWRERMAALMKGDGLFDPDQNTWRHDDETRVLNVSFTKLPRVEGLDLWELRMNESILIPREWQLSPAESKVALLLFQGLENKEIALALGRGGETVKSQVAAVLRKSGVSRRGGLAFKALRP